MTSHDLTQTIDRLLRIETPTLKSALEELSAVAGKVFDAVSQTATETENNPIIVASREARNTISSVRDEFRKRNPLIISRELDQVEDAFTSFYEGLAGGDESRIKTIKKHINAFREDYVSFIQYYSAGGTLKLVQSAKVLNALINSERDWMRLVATALNPQDEAASENRGRMSLFFDSNQDIAHITTKLDALQNIYEELCQLLSVSEGDHPLELAKIESGSLWLVLLGHPKIIKLMEKYADAALSYFHSNYTREGKVAAIPKQLESLDAVLKFQQCLEESGVDATLMRANIQKAAAKVSQDLNQILGGEPVVTINGKEHSVSIALRQRMIESKRTLLFEDKPIDRNGEAEVGQTSK